MYVSCYQSRWASVCLLQSDSSYRREACRDGDSVSYSLSCGCGPRGGLHPATGAPTEDPIVPQHTLSWKPRALSKLIVSELTASLQKRLNACSLIIWILVNWINCWIESVLLKMTKKKKHTRAGGSKERRINILPVRSPALRTREHAQLWLCFLLSPLLLLAIPADQRFFLAHAQTQTVHVTQVKWMSASKSREITVKSQLWDKN